MKQGFKAFSFYLIIPAFFALIFNEFTNRNLMLSNIIFNTILLLYFFIFSRKELKNDLINFKKEFKKYIPVILKWTIISFILMVLSNYLIQLFVDYLPNNEINNRYFIQDNLILALIYLLIVAPFLEEYVFRFSFKIKNYYLYTFITSSLFASLHLLSANNLQELLYFIPYFSLGFGLSNIYYKTKNYFATTLAHIIHNTICVIIILIF